MPSMCIVLGCRTGYRPTYAEKVEGKLPPKLAFHKFPTKHPELFAKWKAALSFMDLSSTTNWERAGVCQRHFVDEDYMTVDINKRGQPRKRMRLKPDAVPRLFDTDNTGFPADCLPKVSELRKTKLATVSPESFVKTLVELSGYTLEEVKEHMAPLHEDQVASDEKMAKEFIEEVDINFERLEPGKAVRVGHLCGYLAWKAQRHLKCASCQDSMVGGNKTLMPSVQVTDSDKLPETFREMIDIQDSGGLLYPSNKCIHMAMMAVEVFKTITAPGERRAKFLGAYSSEEVFVSVYREIMNSDLGMSLLNCEKGCSLVNTIVPAIARSLFHVMAKNVVSIINSDGHTKVKRSNSDAPEKATRSRSDYKKQKLSNNKINVEVSAADSNVDLDFKKEQHLHIKEEYLDMEEEEEEDEDEDEDLGIKEKSLDIENGDQDIKYEYLDIKDETIEINEDPLHIEDSENTVWLADLAGVSVVKEKAQAEVKELESVEGDLKMNPVSSSSKKTFEWTKTATLVFIEMMKQYPSLWNKRSKEYKMKSLRSASWQRMKEGLERVIKCEFSKDDLMKKMHTLKSQFQREKNAIKASKMSGDGSDDVYTPKLWCFDKLSFLADCDLIPSPTTYNNNSDESTSTIQQVSVPPSPHCDEETVNDVSVSVSVSNKAPSSSSSPSCSVLVSGGGSRSPPTLSLPGDALPTHRDPPATSSGPPKKSSSNKRKQLEDCDAVMKLALERLSSLPKIDDTDQCLTTSKVVFSELKNMKEQQRKIAKKLIHEVLSLGDLGLLTLEHKVVKV